MLSREDEVVNNEEYVEEELIKIFNESGNLTFISCSSQNIDRIVSVYRACMKTNTLFVIDPYTAYILDSLRCISNSIPQYDWDSGIIKIFFIPNKYTRKILMEKKMYKFKKAIIRQKDIFSANQKLLIKDSSMMRKIFKKKNLLKYNTLVYSLWEGYLKEQNDFWHENEVNLIKLHVSGHAYVEDIKRLIDSMKPGYIIPMHTDFPEKFKTFGFDNILFPENGETIII